MKYRHPTKALDSPGHLRWKGNKEASLGIGATLAILSPFMRDQKVEGRGGIDEAARALGSSEWLSQ